jgi:hypothetical protein
MEGLGSTVEEKRTGENIVRKIPNSLQVWFIYYTT